MFRAHYMLAFGHYEQATNELAKAMTMMERPFQVLCKFKN